MKALLPTRIGGPETLELTECRGLRPRIDRSGEAINRLASREAIGKLVVVPAQSGRAVRSRLSDTPGLTKP